MKKVIMLLMVMAGWTSHAFAQEDFKEDIIKDPYDDRYMPNSTNKDIISLGLSGGKSILEILRDEFGVNNPQINRLSAKSRDDKAMSKFQLVVDEKGKVLDCSMVKSTNRDKDEKMLNCLAGKNFYEEVSTVDGKPCKSMVMLSLRYHKNGDIDVKYEGYPLIPLPDSETASTDSIPSN